MTDAPDNPAAFPRTCEHFNHKQEGMTLHDYFAGQALAGLLSSSIAYGPIMQGEPDLIAKAALNVATSMLAARKAKP